MSVPSEEVALARETHNGSRSGISTHATNEVQRRTGSYSILPPAKSKTALGQFGVHQITDPHQQIFREGDPADYYFRVREGIVCAEKILVDGRRQILGIFFSGDYFGFSESGEYEYSAEAVNAGSIVQYKRRQLVASVDQDPSTAHRLVATMASEIRAGRERSLILGCRAPIERVTTFLLMLAERQERENGAPVQLDMTRAQIGDYLGLCMETVSRCISRLRADRIIELASPHQIVIVDRDGLNDLANPAILEAL